MAFDVRLPSQRLLTGVAPHLSRCPGGALFNFQLGAIRLVSKQNLIQAWLKEHISAWRAGAELCVPWTTLVASTSFVMFFN